MPNAPVIALFDIDGTLLASGGAGRRAMERALRSTFGATGPAEYRYDGKTDRQIVRELMRAEGLEDDAIDAGMETVFARYLDGLAAEVTDVRRLPGVGALLDALEARSDVVLGLLTGNVEAGARAKLGAAGLDPARFAVGAFGSDHEHRPELPRIARERAIARLGRDVPPDALVVIGDTPLDVACAHAQGARCVAVATGRFTVADLAEHRPAVVLEDLGDLPRALEAICGA